MEEIKEWVGCIKTIIKKEITKQRWKKLNDEWAFGHGYLDTNDEE